MHYITVTLKIVLRILNVIISGRPVRSDLFEDLISGCRKRGVEFKGGSLRDGFGGFDRFDRFGSSGEHHALLLLVLQNTAQ